MKLQSGVRILRLITSGAYTLDYHVSYDLYHGDRVTRTTETGGISTATTTTIAGSTNASPILFYDIQEVILKNTDTSSNTVTLITTDSASADARELTPAITLAAEETLIYSNGVIQILDSAGVPVSSSATKKMLGQSAPSATTETTLYTVPSGKTARATALTVCNRSAATVTFRVSVSVGGGATANKDYFYYDVSLAANSTFARDVDWYMSSGDIVRVYASTADLSFNLSGEEG